MPKKRIAVIGAGDMASTLRAAVAQSQPVTLDKAGLATTLFALRYLQANYDDSGIEESVHFKGESFTPLSPDEIDRLCEMINTRDVIMWPMRKKGI